MADSQDTTTGRSPAFQFYAQDFTAGTLTLSTEEVGAYILLMCHCWDKGSIPSDNTLLCRIARLTPQRMRKVWPALLPKFLPVPDGGYIQPRIEKVRQAQLEFRRRQTDNGKKGGRPAKPKPTLNPDVTQTLPKHKPTPNPNESSPVSGLRSPEEKEKSVGVGNGPDPETKALAFELQQIYPEVFAACRTSAVYRTVQALQERDGPKYYALAELYPDIRKLRAMLEIFLTRDMGGKNSPGSPGQFLNMAPECDEILRRSGWRA